MILLHYTKRYAIFKLGIIYFCNFPFNIFTLQLTVSETAESETADNSGEGVEVGTAPKRELGRWYC